MLDQTRTPSSQATRLRRWVVYSTYSAAGKAEQYVVEQLEHYRLLGFDVMVVDTSPSISRARADDWSRISTHWFERPNTGYDFGSYRAGLELVASEEKFDLLLANDSCFGPFFPLQRVFDSFHGAPAGTAFGITDSHEVAFHLQSYWLYFPSDVAARVLEFFDRLPVATDRDEAILTGEIALSRFLLARDCVLRPYTRVEDIVRACAGLLPYPIALAEFGWRRALKRYRYTKRGDGACLKQLLRKPDACSYVNPTLDFGPTLHAKSYSPFIKRSLLRSNPTGDRTLPSETDIANFTNSDASDLLAKARHGALPCAPSVAGDATERARRWLG